jgi:curved DNA-binding protein CbpA
MYTDFNNLKYNLYQLLNVQNIASKDEISSSFRRIIIKFHPDKQKLTQVEEELYYDITTAYHILMNDKNRLLYDNYLMIKNNNNGRQVNQNTNYQQYNNEAKQYVPDTKEEAVKQYLKQSDELYKRHGTVNIPKGKLTQLMKDKNNERENIQSISREDFRDSRDFNDKFIERKSGGNYSDKIVEYKGGQIMPFELSNSTLSLTHLKDFHNMYSEDTIIEKNMTSLSQAFLLQPHTDIEENFDYNEKINERDNSENTFIKFNKVKNFNFEL